MIDLCEDEEAPPTYPLRSYQHECRAAVREGWKKYSRMLCVLATGAGKTVIFSTIAADEVAAGGRVLIIAHTDELLDQAIDKIKRTTGLEADKEKSNERASPFSKIVVASIQTLSRTQRLLGFSEDHFTLVICDESHRILAASYQKVVRYFHFGAQSLEEGWVMPDREFPHKYHARCLGFTATADRGDGRSLGEFYEHCCFQYGLLEACRDGFLVRPVVKNVPLKIDLKRRSKDERITTGGDYNAGFIEERIRPFIGQIAKAVALHAGHLKNVLFLPSIDSARMMSEALLREGLDASFVSGKCEDRNEKIDAFHRKGPGSAIANAMLLTEGWDCPDASCISVLRPTKIRSLFAQCVGRATRTLTGVIDGLETAEERLAAIAASDKPEMMILDFLWAADSMDLIQPVDLFATKPEQRKAMMDSGIKDLVAAERETRDLVAALEKAALKHKDKVARTYDPLSWAVSIGDAKLASYTPTEEWEMQPITEAQRALLTNLQMDASKIKHAGHAQKLIQRLLLRKDLKLASAAQISFLHRLGYPDDQICEWTQAKAGFMISQGPKRPAAAQPAPVFQRR